VLPSRKVEQRRRDRVAREPEAVDEQVRDRRRLGADVEVGRACGRLSRAADEVDDRGDDEPRRDRGRRREVVGADGDG
jgi:hypothetical protein